ncbi:MAG: VOC family protein [Acidimicrobiaceae bacterium]|nr:VOC family protein [Acidimicrobiaceae bacterium]
MNVGPLRFFHVNVNCSDLERSLEFYRDRIGLRPTVRTRPEHPSRDRSSGSRRCSGTHGCWPAMTLPGEHCFDLLEWKFPVGEGSPPETVFELGFSRLCITSDDLAGLHQQLTETGHDVWSPPVRPGNEAEDLTGREYFLCSDPDGTSLQFVRGDSTRLAGVNVNCSDLERSRHFYCDVLGLEAQHRFTSADPQPVEGFGAEDMLSWDAWRIGGSDGDSGQFTLDLVEWKSPKAGRSAQRRANELGIFRMALLTDDIDRDYAALLNAEITCFPPPVALEMGPGLPSDLRALFFLDPDGTCVELIESPRTDQST